MSSLAEVGSVDFLKRCEALKVGGNNIIESLGLINASAGRAPPKFKDPNVAEMYKTIIRDVDELTEGGEQHLQLAKARLIQEETLKSFVEELGKKYGDMLWGRKTRKHLLVANDNSRYRQFLHWDVERDRKTIQFYLRCWIIRMASQRINHKLREAKRNREGDKEGISPRATPPEGNSDFIDISSDSDELSNKPPNPNPTTPRMARDKFLDDHFRAPPAQVATPPQSASRTRITTPRTIGRQHATYENESNLDENNFPVFTTPESGSKRKSVKETHNTPRVKLPKLSQYKKAVPQRLKQRQEDIYTVPLSPPGGLFVTPGPTELPPGIALFGQRRRRSNSAESDPNWIPTSRGSVDSEAQFTGRSPDQSLTSLVRSVHDRETHSNNHIISADSAPKVLERYPFLRSSEMRDSVIPDSTHELESNRVIESTELELPRREDSVVETPRSMTVAPRNVALLQPTESSEQINLRRELFKLLLSRLNNLYEFSEGKDSHETEERLDFLLSHFWVNDQAHLEAKFGSRFPTLQRSYKFWMDMRCKLSSFQRTTGFKGAASSEWQAYLRTIHDCAQRAEAAIAHIPLTTLFENSCMDGTLDDDLKTIFDELTRYPWCNGAEEFGGVEGYNKRLCDIIHSIS